MDDCKFEWMKSNKRKTFPSGKVCSQQLFGQISHDLADLCLAGFSAHLHKHRPDHFLIDRRMFTELLFEILLGNKECYQSGDCGTEQEPQKT